MKYESSPKHKEPWHHGQSGTLCPRWSWDIAQSLLDGSELVGKVRYAVRDGVAFKGHEHTPGHWHGHPVAWNKVDPKLVTRRQVRGLHTSEDLESALREDRA